MPQSEAENLVEMKHVHKTFNKGTVNEVALFSDFNLAIKKGEFVSVVGSNGSGKTTMLNIICGSTQIDSGIITVKNRDIGHLKEHQRASFIGRVFQDPGKGRVPLTVLENLSLADNKGSFFGLSTGIRRSKIDYFRSLLEQLKLGLEDKIDIRVGSLSGGQRQALALLIATMVPIDLLILDEHTAALDPRSSETVMELTYRIVTGKGITTLMVTHNLRYAVEYGSRLLMMHQHLCGRCFGRRKGKAQVPDLLKVFNEISIGAATELALLCTGPTCTNN